MNRLEKLMITKLLEPKNVTEEADGLHMHVAALKKLPREFSPLLPMAESCLTALPGITGAKVNAPEGTLVVQYNAGTLTKDDVLQWYRLVFREALEETETTPPQNMTGTNAAAIAERAMKRRG